MKFTKMSLVAALLIGSSAFAIDNVKVSGDAKVFYSTADADTAGYTGIVSGNNGSLFDKDSSAADTAVSLDATADLYKNDLVSISAGAGVTAVSTLGLENNFVSNVWGGSHKATLGTGATYANAVDGAKVENAFWVDEAWVAVSAGKTTAKLGRMELDTPLVFTEKWSVEKNTFEAAVLINQDIPDTTLVGAYVGNGNGTETLGQNLQSNTINVLGTGKNLAVGPVVNQDGDFGTFGVNGAYAIGAINNSFKPLTVQAWYYQLTQLADAYWLQADLDASSLGVDGLSAGAQYTSLKLKHGNTDSSSVYALKLGYEMKNLFAASIAYSSVDKKGVLTAKNTATSTGASKLYTEAWWNYRYVTQLDTDSYNVTVTSPVNGLFDLGLYYTNANNKSAANNDLTEFTATAGKSFGPLDATLAYVNAKAKDQNNDSNYNMIQAYLTLNF